MAVTVKQLAKQERVSQQAIRARITRIPNFKKKYTNMVGNIRMVQDAGVKILHQHRDKPHKHYTLLEKRLNEKTIKDLTARNKDLEYQLKHNDKTAILANIKDLRATAGDLRNDKHELNKTIDKLQSRVDYLMYQNQQLTYYKKTNWLERLLGMKSNLKKSPVKTIEPASHTDNSKNSK